MLRCVFTCHALCCFPAVRIEDARRSLNVAKASVEDPIQVFEILGAGAVSEDRLDGDFSAPCC